MIDGARVDDSLEVGAGMQPRVDAVELMRIGEASARFGSNGLQESMVGGKGRPLNVGCGDDEDTVVNVRLASQRGGGPVGVAAFGQEAEVETVGRETAAEEVGEGARGVGKEEFDIGSDSGFEVVVEQFGREKHMLVVADDVGNGDTQPFGRGIGADEADELGDELVEEEGLSVLSQIVHAPAPDAFAEDEGRAQGGGRDGDERYVGSDVADAGEEERLDRRGDFVVAERSLERRLLGGGVENGGIERERGKSRIGSGDSIDGTAERGLDGNTSVEGVESVEIGGGTKNVEDGDVETLDSSAHGGGAGGRNLVENGQVEGRIGTRGRERAQELVGREDRDIDAVVGFESTAQGGDIGVRGGGDDGDALALVEDADVEREGVVGDGMLAVGSGKREGVGLEAWVFGENKKRERGSETIRSVAKLLCIKSLAVMRQCE